MVDKDDCAVIVPIDNGRVWLVEQFRYTIQERTLELPQGGWEMEIDNPEELARDELRAEIGLNAKEIGASRHAMDRLRIRSSETACLSGYRTNSG